MFRHRARSCRRLGPWAVLLFLGAATVLGAAPASAQDGRAQVDLERLSADQRRLAEQARRLERLLASLEEREREAGETARAELLHGARERLRQGLDDRDLVQALEDVAASLAELRTGEALESQARLIELLEEILDYLLERELYEQMEAMLENARERAEILEDLAARQEQLLQETRQLQEAEARSGRVDAERRAEIARRQAEIEARARAFAEREDAPGQEAERAREGAEAGEEARRALTEGLEEESAAEEDEARGGEPQEGKERPGEAHEKEPQAGDARPGAAKPGEPQQGEPQQGEPQQGEAQQGEPEQGEPQPGEPEASPPASLRSPNRRPRPGENLDRAQEKQEEALEHFQDAAREAAEAAEHGEQQQRREQLLDLATAARELLERHLQVEKELTAFAEEQDGRRPPRSARVRLRAWAAEEQALAEATDELQITVREAGADAFPFLMDSLREDHERLASALGPPRYRAGDLEVALAGDLQRGWETLIEALEREAERIRQRLEAPPNPGGGEQDPEEERKQRIVEFRADLELLAILQRETRDRLERLLRRRELLAEAGIPFDRDDERDLQSLLERQARLRRLYEAMLERFLEEGGPVESEDA